MDLGLRFMCFAEIILSLNQAHRNAVHYFQVCSPLPRPLPRPRTSPPLTRPPPEPPPAAGEGIKESDFGIKTKDIPLSRSRTYITSPPLSRPPPEPPPRFTTKLGNQEYKYWLEKFYWTHLIQLRCCSQIPTPSSPQPAWLKLC